jgi:hypothetical protein
VSILNRSNHEGNARLAALAKNFPVTRLPYAGEPRHLKYNPPGYGKRPIRVGKHKLSFEDFQNGMHITSRATAYEMRLFYAPLFSANDEQLRLVIAQQAYDYVRAGLESIAEFYKTEKVPNGFVLNREALENLAKKATEAKKKVDPRAQKINHYSHIMWCEPHGGHVALRATIADRAWREAKDSHTIANELGMSWEAVRTILYRLCNTARRLGLETFPRHHTAFKDRVYRPYDFDKEPKAKLCQGSRAEPNIESAVKMVAA